MNTLKAIILTTIISTPLSVYANISYIPSQLEQFNKTGACINCDLSEARLSDHDNADLTGALLVRADFSGHFYVSNFSHAQLMYADLANIKASGSNLSSADLTGASLANSNFSSCNFENANVSGANLSGSDLARSNITKEQLSQAASIDCAILPDGSRSPKKNGGAC